MEQKNKYAFSLFVIGSLFFIFGFITWVNSILMPFLQITCELTEFQSAFVPFAFYISYFVMSIPASFLIKKVGYSNGMMIGLLTMAIGSILFKHIADAQAEAVATDCETCKWQIEMSTGLPVENPISILADALDVEATHRANSISD